MLQKKVFHSYDYTQPRNPFAEIQLITAERGFDKLYVVDWNSDGLPDLQVVHYGVFGEEFTGCVFGGHPNGGHYQQIQRLDLMHNSHMGMFENTDFGSRPQRQRLSVGDWNGDGLLDVVVSPATPYSLAVSRPTVLENHPEGARQGGYGFSECHGYLHRGGLIITKLATGLRLPISTEMASWISSSPMSTTESSTTTSKPQVV